jgi:nucleoid-associated protein YgaU
MISSRSRYVDGRIVAQPEDGKVVAYRNFPPPPSDQVAYTWKQSDRLDRIAGRFLGSGDLWWKILDANPLLQGPGDLRPGMQIRIPSRV